MMRKTTLTRMLKKVAPLTAAAVLLSAGGALAQVGMPNSGMMSPNLGVPGAATSPPTGSGIPLGASSLGTGGLSPMAPLAMTPGSSLLSQGFPSNTGLGMGTGSSLGGSLSPTLAPSAPPGFPSLGVTAPAFASPPSAEPIFPAFPGTGTGSRSTRMPGLPAGAP